MGTVLKASFASPDGHPSSVGMAAFAAKNCLAQCGMSVSEVELLINVGVFELLLYTGSDYRIANLIALILTKLFAYIVNNRYVFTTKSANLRESMSEFMKYYIKKADLVRGNIRGQRITK